MNFSITIYLKKLKIKRTDQEMVVQICVGSSCHLKGSEKLVELFQKAITEHHLENDITLAGSFCNNKCNRIGVTVSVDDTVHIGVTPERFETFFQENVLNILNRT